MSEGAIILLFVFGWIVGQYAYVWFLERRDRPTRLYKGRNYLVEACEANERRRKFRERAKKERE